MTNADPVIIDSEVADALARGRGVVALESTIISHGLPRPDNARIAREIEASVRDRGAVPATIAVVDGQVRVGLDDDALDRIAGDDTAIKASVRDLGAVVATGGVAGTTVASTAYLAHRSGIRIFATGGLGGVHRGAADSWDESADLAALASIPITLVCAGVKSILDVGATLERLETLSISLVGYGTDTFPGFYIRDSGYPIPWRVDRPRDLADMMVARDRLALPQALVVANPVPADDEMDAALHAATLDAGLAALDAADVHGKDVTPFLLAYFHDHTGGASLASNVALVLNNARVAGEIAVAWSGR